MPDENMQPTSVNHVTLRIPDFHAAHPEMWRLLERNFTVAGITSEATKFNFAADVLPQKYAKYENVRTRPIRKIRNSTNTATLCCTKRQKSVVF